MPLASARSSGDRAAGDCLAAEARVHEERWEAFTRQLLLSQNITSINLHDRSTQVNDEWEGSFDSDSKLVNTRKAANKLTDSWPRLSVIPQRLGQDGGRSLAHSTLHTKWTNTETTRTKTASIEDAGGGALSRRSAAVPQYERSACARTRACSSAPAPALSPAPSIVYLVSRDPEPEPTPRRVCLEVCARRLNTEAACGVQPCKQRHRR